MFKIRRWSIGAAYVTIRILALGNSVGLRCVNCVRVKFVWMGCVICFLLVLLMRMRTHGVCTPCFRGTASSRQKKKGLTGWCFAVSSRHTITFI